MSVKEYHIIAHSLKSGRINDFTIWERNRIAGIQEAIVILKCLYQDTIFKIEKTTETTISINGENGYGIVEVNAIMTSKIEEDE